MKKDKKWLEEQIKYLQDGVGESFNDYSKGLNSAYNTLELLINQLEEPEKEKQFYIRDKVRGATLMLFDLSDGGIEFVDGFSKEETLIFKEKEKAELIAKYVDGTAEEVTE